jgi:hypothetical protein
MEREANRPVAEKVASAVGAGARKAVDAVKNLGEDGYIGQPRDLVGKFSAGKKESPFKAGTGDAGVDAKAKITHMSPDEYLKQAFEATDGKLGGSYESWLKSNRHDSEIAQKYAEAMKRLSAPPKRK